MAFDTLKFARALREKAKLSPEQAEGFAEAISEAVQGDLATKADLEEVRGDIEALRLATKADIEALKLSTKADIEALRLATKADIETVRAEVETLRLSTKSDIEAVKAEVETLRLSTKADLRETELRLEARIESTKADIIKWMFGTIGFQTLIILGAVIALTRVIRP